MIRRLLVALSGTETAGSAIEQAVGLAQRHRATLVGVTDMSFRTLEKVGGVPLGAAAAAADLVEHRLTKAADRMDAAVRTFEHWCRESGIAYELHRETGSPFAALARHARCVDLVVAGLQGLFDDGVIQSPDDELIRVLEHGIKPILATSGRARNVHHVMVAYHGSASASQALRSFLQVGAWPEARITVVSFGAPDGECDGARCDAARLCSAHGYTTESLTIADEPRRALLPLATERGADLLVLGATPRTKLARRVLGDTVLHAIRQSEIPLFLDQ